MIHSGKPQFMLMTCLIGTGCFTWVSKPPKDGYKTYIMVSVLEVQSLVKQYVCMQHCGHDLYCRLRYNFSTLSTEPFEKKLFTFFYCEKMHWGRG